VASVSRSVLVSLASAVAVAAACALPAPRVPVAPGVSLPDRIDVRLKGRVTSVRFEDYVLGSALAEVTPVGESPAAVSRIYEVQAIIARTYAVAHLGRHRGEGFDVCDATHCQLYDPARIATSRFSAVAAEAVRRTAGEVLTYGRRPVDALYHADCGGSTSAADAIWGGRPLPYLRGTGDDLPAATHRTWTFSTGAEALRSALNRDPRTAVGTRFTGIDVNSRDEGGRATSLTVRGSQDRVVRGEDLRAVLNRSLGDRAIQSTRFAIRRTGTSYTFEGTGFGHGVGLCQAGAAARARRGDELSDILRTYFADASLAIAGQRSSLSRRPD
jgi:stage II sporulation protein D (peptidoglycan lytic transglycosylase)